MGLLCWESQLVLQKQRTWASRVAGSAHGEAATAMMMVPDDTWCDPVLQANASIMKQWVVAAWERPMRMLRNAMEQCSVAWSSTIGSRHGGVWCSCSEPEEGPLLHAPRFRHFVLGWQKSRCGNGDGSRRTSKCKCTEVGSGSGR